MNTAFTIGRLCDTEEGRNGFVNLKKDTPKLIGSLVSMIEQNQDFGCTKNACFALSCLAGNETAHLSILNHISFDKLTKSLCHLLVNISDVETQWFAAM